MTNILGVSMRITVSELKRIIKEEVMLAEAGTFKSKIGGGKDVKVGDDLGGLDEKGNAAVEKLVKMIDGQKNALGFKPQDEEAFSSVIGGLLQALAAKYKVSAQKLSRFATHVSKDMKANISDSKPGTQTTPTK